MKILEYIIAVLCFSVAFASCSPAEQPVDFGTDATEVAVGPDGGESVINIASEDEWIASTDSPWIVISPANGRGSVSCGIVVDSTLSNEPRTGYVRIENVLNGERKEIVVKQEGYPHIIEINEPEVSISNYAGYDDRSFEVKVRTNVDFTVSIPDTIGWLSNKSYNVKLERGARPRNVYIRFDWKVNSIPAERMAQISFNPKADTITLARQDVLKVTQQASELIEPGTREADSLAVIGISRALDLWSAWENPEPMDHWENVRLWEERDPGCTPEKVGRVKYASFFIFSTKEGLPYEVQYLTEAEELYFYSNTNSFLYNINPGEYITKLTNLKRLTIGAYGLTELPESFANLKNLEYLNLSGNNFQSIPDVLTKENFPKLHYLNINANQRNMVYDLSNTVATNLGGLYDEPGFPRDLLEWETLDTLIVSVNYLQGSLPDMEDYEVRWTEADIMAADTLPPALIGTPKVLPNMKHLAINLNRLTGNAPDWLLYHPALDWWIPYIFIFSQEGKDVNGNSAGFDNEPASLTYYYDFYKGYKDNPLIYEDEVTE